MGNLHSSNNNSNNSIEKINQELEIQKNQIENTDIIDLIENKESVFLNKILSNIVIKRQIFNQVRLLNCHSKPILVNIKLNSEIESLLNYKYKNYIKSIIINNFDKNNLDDIFNINKIIKSLDYLETIEIQPYLDNNSNNNSEQQQQQQQQIYIDEKIINVENNLKNLKLDFEVNQFLKINFLNIQSLKLKQIPQEIELFKNLKELEFYSNFNQEIPINILPNSLEKLKFGTLWDAQLKKNTLPNNLKVLEFSRDSFFNNKIGTGVLPKSLKRLVFGQFFNKSIEIGETTIEYLKFGQNFNKQLQQGSLPTTLKYLEFGDCYNSPLVEGVLPKSLETIKFGMFWHTELNSKKISLPNQIKKIKFSHFISKSFTINVDDQNTSFIPNSCESLQLPFDIKINNRLVPPSVKRIKRFNFSNIHLLPTSVEYYKFPYYSNTILTADGPNSLPRSLTSVTFDEYYNLPLSKGIFSNNIKQIEFGKYFNQTINQDVLPSSLQVLIFGNNFKKPLNLLKLLSNNSNLRAIKFGLEYNIKFKVFNNQSEEEKEISRINEENEENEEKVMKDEDLITILPNSIKLLEVGKKYEHSLSNDNLPQSLEQLILNGSNESLILPLPQYLNTVYIETDSIKSLTKYYQDLPCNNNNNDSSTSLFKKINNNKRLFKNLIKNKLV